MNKLTITRNGTTVAIEQVEPISADIIVRTLAELGKSTAPLVPQLPFTPCSPFMPKPHNPWSDTIEPKYPMPGQNPYRLSDTGISCRTKVEYDGNPSTGHFNYTPEMQKNSLFSYTDN